MKKIIKVLSIIILIISIFLVFTIVVSNLIIIIRIMFFGLTVGSSEYPDSIWWKEMILHGTNGIITYYSVCSELVFIIEIPIIILCIIYQFVYFKIIRKKL